MKINIILSGIQDSGNLGSIARLCDNFNVNKLILVNPRCEIDDTAYQRATRARRFLDEIIILESIEDAREMTDYIVAMSGKNISPNNIARIPQPIENIAQTTILNGTLGLLFGNESSGLSTEEILQADQVAIINTSGANNILNIASATAIALYVFSQTSTEDSTMEFMTGDARKVLHEYIDVLIQKVMPYDEIKESMSIILKNVLGRAVITRKEANALIGFFKNVNKTIMGEFE